MNPSLIFIAVREGHMQGDKQETEGYHSASNPQWNMEWGIFRSESVLPTPELDTCTELTTLWPRWSSTPFFRDMLHSLVCIFVEKGSYQRMTSKTPQSFARTTSKSRIMLCHGLSCSHLTLTPLNIYGSTWRLKKPSVLGRHKQLFGTLSNHAWITTSHQVSVGMLSLKNVGHTKDFLKFMWIFQRFNFSPNC